MAIARAVYSDSDIYLVDDCLSALDPEVSKAILENVILGELKYKTRLVVTHFYHHFKDSERVIFMKNGAIQIDGEYRNVRGTNEFREYAKEIQENIEKEEKAYSEKLLKNKKNMFLS